MSGTTLPVVLRAPGTDRVATVLRPALAASQSFAMRDRTRLVARAEAPC